jgi:hypothetical protein
MRDNSRSIFLVLPNNQSILSFSFIFFWLNFIFKARLAYSVEVPEPYSYRIQLETCNSSEHR